MLADVREGGDAESDVGSVVLGGMLVVLMVVGGRDCRWICCFCDWS